MRLSILVVTTGAIVWTQPLGTAGLNAYGHAYSRPHDFTASEYAQIASKFAVFTVEKNHAADVYGNTSASPPFTSNSIAATVGTARKIKAINASVKVLMYWNSAIHFDFYECESEVQPSWLHAMAKKPPYYNYSVPAFREWWVRCAVDAVTGNAGAIDGLFLDATPKIETQGAIGLWDTMVDELRAKLPPDAIVVNNGFYLSPTGGKDAGDDAWSHTDTTYVEHMSTIGTSGNTPGNSVLYLQWLANATAAHPERVFYGHGHIDAANPDSMAFRVGLASYLLVTSSVERGFFLANDGNYSIDGGLLVQPAWAYLLGCGEPTAMLTADGSVVSRPFEHGRVELDVAAGTANIACIPTRTN